MAADMFLKIAGIDGESIDDEHTKTIEVMSFSWGQSQPVSFSTGTGGGAGKASLQDLQIVKYVDSATPKIGFALVKGTHLDKAELFCRKAGDKPYNYLHVTLTDVMVSTQGTSGASGTGDMLLETISLAYSKILLEYFVQAADGTVKTAGKFSWDMKKNVASNA